MTAVVDALFIHIGDVDVAIRASLDIDRSKPGIIRLEDSFDVRSLKRRLIRLEIAQHHLPLKRFNPEQLASKPLGQSVLFVDDEVVRESCDSVMLDVFEEAKRVRVRRSVFAKALAIVAALNVVKAASVSAVVAGKDAAFVVDLTAERVASAFREDFVDVSPDGIAR